jgi:TP901 family phage tail tape measure protein
MPGVVGLAWDLLARDKASPAFLRVAGAADQAATATSRASLAMSGATARAGKTGAALTKKLTLPLAGLAAVAVEQAAKYQKSLTTIGVITDQTSTQMQAASKGLMGVAKSTGTSLDQLTQGLYTVEKGGFRGAKALAIVKAGAQGAKAENVDLGTAMAALTSIMASYGKTLGDPVKAENELIKGSGLAKTTMQDFADSLSNVVPVASSLHISFSDVAAAIATMTQHGETAQHATENLRNLITNLAGQNNVASQAMQQLGINTIRVSKNLGKPGVGLVGTLDYVLGRVQKLGGKDGLVVVDTFKHAALATSSLNKMLSTMSDTVKTNSEGLLHGKVGISDYTKFAKSMGGQAGASALQFLALYKSSLGFSNLIKTGKGNVSTYAATLQKMLGGVTGMNTALQLSGQSAGTFHRNAKAIAKVALEAGSNVLGWSQVSQTLSVKMDKAKASLQVMAVEIGTALIPAVSKIAGAVSGAVHWFDELSGTQKKILGWSLGIMAGIGPLLSIGSRFVLLGRSLGGFTAGIGTAFSKLAGLSEGAAGRVNVAMRGVAAAIGGAAIGTAVGTLTQNASTGVQALGVLGSAAAGAALGFGAGGPWGALIGGIAGAGSALIHFGHHAKDQIEPTQALTQAILDDGDAFGKLTRASTVQTLQSKGLFDAALKLGISQKTVTDAALGNAGALSKVNATLTEQGLKAAGAYTSGRKLTQAQRDQLNAADKLRGGLDLQSRTLAVNKKAADNEAAALGGVKKKTDDASGAIRGITSSGNNYLDVVAKINARKITIRAQDNASAVIAKIKLALRELRNKQISIDTYERRIIVPTIDRTPGGPTGEHSGPGRASGGSLPQGLASVGERGAELAYTHGGKTQILSHAQSLAFLARTGMHFPGFASGTSGAMASIAAALSKLGLSRAGSAGVLGNLKAESNFNPNAYNPSENAHGFAQWEGSRWTALQNYAKSQGLAATSTAAEIGYLVKELRGSGLLGQLRSARSPSAAAALVDAQFERSSGSTRGLRESYATSIFGQLKSGKLAAAVGKAAKPKVNVSALTTKLGTAIGNIGSAAGGPKFSVTDIGIDRVMAQIKTATSVLVSDVKKGLSAKAARPFRDELVAYTKMAKQQVKDLRVKIRGSDLNGIRAAIGGTASDMRAAFMQILTDMKRAGVTSGGIAAVQARQKTIIAKQATLAAASSKLASMKTYRAGIQSTLAGAFDPTKYGSAQDFIVGLGGATDTNKAYAGELTSLHGKAKGNKPLMSLINTLAVSGQTTSLQSLAGASKTDLANVGKAYSGYTSSLTAGGNAAVMAQYGTSVDAQTKAIAAQTTALKNLVTAVVNRPIHVHANGHEFTMAVLADPAFERQLTREFQHLANAIHYGRKH